MNLDEVEGFDRVWSTLQTAGGGARVPLLTESGPDTRAAQGKVEVARHALQSTTFGRAAKLLFYRPPLLENRANDWCIKKQRGPLPSLFLTGPFFFYGQRRTVGKRGTVPTVPRGKTTDLKCSRMINRSVWWIASASGTGPATPSAPPHSGRSGGQTPGRHPISGGSRAGTGVC
eukprot:gene23144-biopygen17788